MSVRCNFALVVSFMCELCMIIFKLAWQCYIITGHLDFDCSAYTSNVDCMMVVNRVMCSCSPHSVRSTVWVIVTTSPHRIRPHRIASHRIASRRIVCSHHIASHHDLCVIIHAFSNRHSCAVRPPLCAIWLASASCDAGWYLPSGSCCGRPRRCGALGGLSVWSWPIAR